MVRWAGYSDPRGPNPFVARTIVSLKAVPNSVIPAKAGMTGFNPFYGHIKIVAALEKM
jgi:hypothetical protein